MMIHFFMIPSLFGLTLLQIFLHLLPIFHPHGLDESKARDFVKSDLRQITVRDIDKMVLLLENYFSVAILLILSESIYEMVI